MTDDKARLYATAAAVFLNPLEHAGKKYIRLWYKPNLFISKRLKEAAWVKYSRTYKCFVMHHTPQAIEMTHAHFQGLAQVNTRYLYRPKRLKPNKHTAVLAGKLQGEVLQKFPELPIIKLQPLLPEGSETVIGLTFKYHKPIYSALRKSSVARWQEKLKCFAIAPGGQHIRKLLTELQGTAWL